MVTPGSSYVGVVRIFVLPTLVQPLACLSTDIFVVTGRTVLSASLSAHVFSCTRKTTDRAAFASSDAEEDKVAFMASVAAAN